MGGAIGKDYGGMQYSERNIYLNSEKTFGRLKPVRPITIHQKALFCLWMFIIVWFLIVKVLQLWKWIAEKRNEKSTENENNLESQTETDDKNESKTHINGVIKPDTDTSEKQEAMSLWARLSETCAEQPSVENFLSHAVLFGLIMLYFWLCDYQHIWYKTDKQYSRDMFIFIFFLLVFVAFVFTIKKTSDKILNRDQTEEWKGWMQVQFVWYHYYDAQEVFNSIRCYIGAYVWMTGYGNFWYFYTKKDFSFFRLAKMMWRLNFLVVMVMAITNHEFVRYYVCAMHTYWFITVYAMLAVFSRYNQNRFVMAAKFVIFFIFNSIIFEFPYLTYKIFWPFQFVLNVKGNLDYWVYRSTLDHWATWIGMLLAYNYPYYDNFLRYLEKDDGKRRNNLLKNSLKAFLTFVCLIIVGLWFYYFLLVNRSVYRRYHPYTSIIPILAYIWLRNLHPLLRTHYLNLFNWLGKITLETYLSQIHIYMIGDAKKILIYIHKYPMMNFAVATLIYVGVSYVLFHHTVLFSSFLLPRNMRVLCKNFIVSVLLLILCYAFSFLFTWLHVW